MALAICFAAVVFAAGPGASGDDALWTSVRDEHIALTLDVVSASYKQPSRGEFEITRGPRTIWLTNHGTDCAYYAGFDVGGRGDLARINRWNARIGGATRAYLDADGDPCLEMDVDVEGGISAFVFSLYVRAFFVAVDRFAVEVVGDDPTAAGSAAAGPWPAGRRACPRALSRCLVGAVGADNDEPLLNLDRIADEVLAEGYSSRRHPASASKGDDDPPAPVLSIGFRDAWTDAYLVSGLTLATPYPGVKLSLKRINEWNRDHRFSRAYLDADGRPVIADCLPVPLVSKSALAEFFEVYRASLGKFERFARVRTPSPSASRRLGLSAVPTRIAPPSPSGAPGAAAALPPLEGVRIATVRRDSPAQRAGLRPGDVIVSVSTASEPDEAWEMNVADVPSLERQLADADRSAWLWVARGGRYHDVQRVRVVFAPPREHAADSVRSSAPRAGGPERTPGPLRCGRRLPC